MPLLSGRTPLAIHYTRSIMPHFLPFLLSLLTAAAFTQCQPVRPVVTIEPEITRNDPTQWRGHTYHITALTLSEGEIAPPTQLRLTWDAEGQKCRVQLSTNFCALTYEADNAQVSFGDGACTEMCCDTPTEMQFLRQLNGSWQYMMTSDRIELYRQAPAQRIVLQQLPDTEAE